MKKNRSFQRKLNSTAKIFIVWNYTLNYHTGRVINSCLFQWPPIPWRTAASSTNHLTASISSVFQVRFWNPFLHGIYHYKPAHVKVFCNFCIKLIQLSNNIVWKYGFNLLCTLMYIMLFGTPCTVVFSSVLFS